MIREAVWAGRGKFYPDNPEQLSRLIGTFIVPHANKKNAKAIIMPHAGYVYSGPVAGKTISQVNVPDTVIILAPNHTGLGSPYSIMTRGSWQTPLGKVQIAEQLAQSLIQDSAFIREDESAHIKEHAVEVELPFLQHNNPNTSIVPMVISDFFLEHFLTVGHELAKAITQYKKPVLIVASSDMTHYEPHERAKNKDALAIKAILELNCDDFLETVQKEKISMCGFGPVAVAIAASKKLGAKNAQLIDYQTSGDTSGDYSSVVGYAGIIIT